MDVKMPRLGVNDNKVILTRWLVKNGSSVKKGQKIAYIETSKEASEITAKASGIITLLAKEDDEITVGAVIAQIGEAAVLDEKQEEHSSPWRLTEKARKLIEEHGIDLNNFPKERIIREKDVLPFISSGFSIADSKDSDIIIFGAVGFAKIAIDILRISRSYRVCGIVDMKYPALKEFMGIPVIGGYGDLERLYEAGYRHVFNAMTDHQGTGKKRSYDMLKDIGFSFPNIIHSSAIMEPDVRLGNGNLICAGTIIGAGARIGSNCIINAGAILSHDDVISDHSNIASGAILAGEVTVGEDTLIGQGVSVYMGVKIGNHVTVENGCSIFKNVPDNTVVRYRGSST